MDVCRAPGVVVVAPRIRTGLDGLELVPAIGVGHGTAGAGEIRVQRRIVQVTGMGIATGGVGLPDLHQNPRNRQTVFVQHAAVNDDALALWLTFVLSGEVIVLLVDALGADGWPGDFRQRMGQKHQRLGRRAQVGGLIGRMQVLRLSTLLRATVTRLVSHYSFLSSC
ncbi:hypothetical protein D3C80_1126240 [compost metagenome]